ncbi:MAG TPA: cell division protein ZapA [bacterium]|nr:cell division protein ZapA [bacterium]
MGKVKVTILRKDYTLDSGDTEENHVQDLARYVNEKMEEIQKDSNTLSSQDIAVLTCLSVAEEYYNFKNSSISSGEDVGKLVSRMKDLLAKALKD